MINPIFHPVLDLRLNEQLTVKELRIALQSTVVKRVEISVCIIFGRDDDTITVAKKRLLELLPDEEWDDDTTAFLLSDHETISTVYS